MGKRINLIGERAERCKERQRRVAERNREQVLGHLPRELAKRKFAIEPTPAIETANVIETESGYKYTEYKSLARLNVQFECDGMPNRKISRTLPDIFEVTEIVYSGVAPED